jgi:iron complex outermembrane receptor protein
VTEAYGYYLNNTFDQYDYMGNTHLANESAVEVNGAYRFSAQEWGIGLDANAFFFKDYIIGHLDSRLSAMTVGAEGVKVYGNLEHAVIANASVTADWQISRRLAWNGKLSYSLGRDDVADALPLISPLAWNTQLNYDLGALQAQVELRGNGRQTNYAAKYGETLTAGWNIVNLWASYRYKAATLRGGVENLFDRKYSAYSDWNNIPQKGRNIYLNLTIEL